jgi:hypothetical protein
MADTLSYLSRERQIASNRAFLDAVVSDPSSVREFDDRGGWDEYLAPLLDQKRSVLATCPHWGSYPQALVRIGCALSKKTPLCVARGQNWDFDELTYWKHVRLRSGLSIDVFRILEEGERERFGQSVLRGANTFVLFDLDAGYGITRPAPVLNWTLWFACGWTLLAYRTRSVVVIFKPASLDRRHDIVHFVIDPLGYSSYKAFTKACMAYCGQCLGELILEQDQYWLNGHSLNKLMSNHGGGA